jgi:deoxyribose-phosphate aldolase
MRLAEIHQAVQDGATEIDIVINRALALRGDWEGVYREASSHHCRHLCLG